MRWLALASVLGACSFERSGTAPEGGGGIDASAVTGDAPPDAPPTPALCATTYPAEFGGHRYRLTDTDYTWDQARAFCAQEGGHLVKVETREEDDFLVLAISGFSDPYVWIGLHDAQLNNTLVWHDGTAVSGFTHWAGGQPSAAAGNDCVDKSTSNIDGTWATFDCVTPKKRGVCECGD